MGQLVGQRALVAGRARRVAVAEDDLVPDGVGVGVDGPRRRRRGPARVHPDVGEVGPEGRLHPLPDGRLERLARALADHVLDRGILLLLALEGGGHAGIARGALEAHHGRRRQGLVRPATRPRGEVRRLEVGLLAGGRVALAASRASISYAHPGVLPGRAPPAHRAWRGLACCAASRGAAAGIKVRSADSARRSGGTLLSGSRRRVIPTTVHRPAPWTTPCACSASRPVGDSGSASVSPRRR